MLEHLLHTLPSIIQAYHAKHDLREVPVLVDNLKPLIEARGAIDRIIWEKYEFASTNIAAQVSFYEGSLGVYAGDGDYARIQYSSSLNFCWRRFAICKEMYHCILDVNDKTRISNIDGLFRLSEGLVADMTSRLDDFEALDTEQDAELLALETLFPLELRSSHREAYDAGHITDYQLALRYRIPQDYARIGMYPNYIKRMADLRGDTLVKIA